MSKRKVCRAWQEVDRVAELTRRAIAQVQHEHALLKKEIDHAKDHLVPRNQQIEEAAFFKQQATLHEQTIASQQHMILVLQKQTFALENKHMKATACRRIVSVPATPTPDIAQSEAENKELKRVLARTTRQVKRSETKVDKLRQRQEYLLEEKITQKLEIQHLKQQVKKYQKKTQQTEKRFENFRRNLDRELGVPSAVNTTTATDPHSSEKDNARETKVFTVPDSSDNDNDDDNDDENYATMLSPLKHDDVNTLQQCCRQSPAAVDYAKDDYTSKDDYIKRHEPFDGDRITISDDDLSTDIGSLSVLDFVNLKCVRHTPEHRVRGDPRPKVFQSYLRLCAGCGQTPVPKMTFYKKLQELGFPMHKSNGTRLFRGLALKNN